MKQLSRSIVTQDKIQTHRIAARIAAMAFSATLVAGGVAIAGSTASVSASTALTTPHATSAAGLEYYLYSLWGTKAECEDEGSHLIDEHKIINFYCEELTEGDYFEWGLYIAAGCSSVSNSARSETTVGKLATPAC